MEYKEDKIIFLGSGTSQGIPMIGCRCSVCTSNDSRDKRLRSALFIEYKGVKFVIDTGPDFRYQMLRENITDIDAILFTHSHKDHIAGLDDVRAYNYILKRGIDIYAEKHTLDVIKSEFHYAFDEIRYPGVPEIIAHTIDTTPFYIKGVKIIPLRGIHYKMPVLGFRIGDVSYITDMNHIDVSEIEKMKGSKILIIDALRRERHISHFTLNEAIEISKQVAAPKTYLTHISHQLGLYQDLIKELPSGIEPSYDRQIISLNSL
ncbi:MAG: MBL fold metallo-hydrolase [Rikenellaceae bacterium]